MTDYKTLLQQQRDKLNKVLIHLDYSYKKVLALPTQEEKLDEETMEVWESFCARFARVTDIFLTRYLRTFVLEQDPGFTGILRDFVNQGEKLGLISNSKTWMHMRELRNINAHEYNSDDLSQFLSLLRNYATDLLSLKIIINS